MWTCPKCGEQIEDQFDSCWKCASGLASSKDEPAAGVQYLVKRGTEEFGPVSQEQMILWIKEQRIYAETLIQVEGASFWQPVRTYPEFAEALAAPKVVPSVSSSATAAPNVLRTAPADFNSHIVRSTLVTLLCCVPFGIVAIVYSARAGTKFDAGDYEGAQKAASKAMTWGTVAEVAVFAQLYPFYLTTWQKWAQQLGVSHFLDF